MCGRSVLPLRNLLYRSIRCSGDDRACSLLCQLAGQGIPAAVHTLTWCRNVS
jgi:hypothetical protein